MTKKEKIQKKEIEVPSPESTPTLSAEEISKLADEAIQQIKKKRDIHL